MNAKRTGWIITIVIALLITGCGTDTKSELQPPSVYKNPQVKITHAPTAIVLDIPTAEATAPATQAVANNLEEPEVELEDQFFLDQVEYLLNKIENELDRMDTNP